jgi:nucleotide-binding universal stress UspA family protein
MLELTGEAVTQSSGGHHMKVLLALDGSAPSLVARDLVANLPWPDGTTVHLVSAYQVPIDWTGGVGSTMAWVGEIGDAIRDELTEQLRSMAGPLVARGLAVEHHVVTGRPADAITRIAGEAEVDLIVTGSRGRGPIRSMLLGSVASEVAADAPVPVLVARRATLDRLLVATDGSTSSARIPELLAEWGIADGTQADVVAVSVPDPPGYELMANLYTLGSDAVARSRQRDAERAQTDADAMAERLQRAGIPATPRVRTGDAAAQILEAASEYDSDLIVTGSRGLGQLERLLLGSVARNVLVHAGCSVLIVRTSADAEPRQEETT